MPHFAICFDEHRADRKVWSVLPMASVPLDWSKAQEWTDVHFEHVSLGTSYAPDAPQPKAILIGHWREMMADGTQLVISGVRLHSCL